MSPGNGTPGFQTQATGVVRQFVLPDAPVLTLRPRTKWVPFNFKELWAYRELTYFIMWRDIKVRYKQTVLGILWAAIQPFATMLVFNLCFSRMARIPSDNIPYPIFSYAALIPWTFFSSAASTASMGLISNSNLISKVYFPRLVIPCGMVGAKLFDFAISFVFLIGMMLWYGVKPTPSLLLLPVLTLQITLLSLGFGLALASVNVRYRDIAQATPFFFQLLMFCSPIIYPLSLVPQNMRVLALLNPVSGIIEGYRAAILGQHMPWMALGVSAFCTLVLLAVSTFAFRQLENHLADIL